MSSCLDAIKRAIEDDGATGVSFPYRTPRTRMRLPLAPA
jgi:hypothetical protein